MDADDALRTLAHALTPYLLDSISKKDAASDWVDVAAALPTCKRVLYRACRTGILSARHIRRRWLARRADLDAWVESHETGVTPRESRQAPERDLVPSKSASPAPQRELTPAQQHEREMEELYTRFGMRRATDAERAARGLPPYDVDREYADFLAAEARRTEEQAARERADRDPVIAEQRAEATRAADAVRERRPSKVPRVTCERCRRRVTQRRDGRPVAHSCPHQFGYGCFDEEGNRKGAEPRCPWCKQERRKG
jgi:hypothetical protein